MIPVHKARRLRGVVGDVRLTRNGDGVVHVLADAAVDLAFGLGFAHVHDRLVQMELARRAARGTLCEAFPPSDALLTLDRASRSLGVAHRVSQDLEALDEEAHERARAYCHGVNRGLELLPLPLPFVLIGHQPRRWSVADSLCIAKMMGWLGLAQSQADMERLIIEATIAGTDVTQLQRLFSPHLDGFDPSVLADVRVGDPLVPESAAFHPGLPALLGSNNWVLSGRVTGSGRPLVAFDPHLDINTLPATWYEVALVGEDNYAVGITVPGVDGLAMGRTRWWAAGATYGFADQVDYYVEQVEADRYRHGDEWRPLTRRNETIRRRGQEPLKVEVVETHRGVVLGPVDVDGRYLCRAWSLWEGGGSAWLNALPKLWRADSLAPALEGIAGQALSANWVVADRHGNIAYQQSGRIPLRRGGWSGLYPVPGWTGDNDWRGFAAPGQLGGFVNPPEQFIATANEDRHQQGRVPAINLPMSAYRAERIRELLAVTPGATTSDMKAIQNDLESIQARRFMPLLRPVLPQDANGARLSTWNYEYDESSQEAAWFEEILSRARAEVFGQLFGEKTWRWLTEETSLVSTYHGHFDDALASGSISWFPDESRAEMFRRICADVLADDSIGPWGQRNALKLENLFFGGRFPDALGFDHGPVPLPGSRATILQTGLLRSGGRDGSFGPSYRFITDLGEDEVLSNLPGGPSAHRLSPWYKADLDRWVARRYKRLAPGEARGVGADLVGPSPIETLLRWLTDAIVSAHGA